jgi:hypothetical protein
VNILLKVRHAASIKRTALKGNIEHASISSLSLHGDVSSTYTSSTLAAKRAPEKGLSRMIYESHSKICNSNIFLSPQRTNERNITFERRRYYYKWHAETSAPGAKDECTADRFSVDLVRADSGNYKMPAGWVRLRGNCPAHFCK